MIEDLNLEKVQTEHRKLEIQSCEGCNGNPKTYRSSIGGTPTDVCEVCLEVVCWYKQKQQARVKTQKVKKESKQKNETIVEGKLFVTQEEIENDKSLIKKKSLNKIVVQQDIFGTQEIKKKIIDRLGFHAISVWTVEKWMSSKLKKIVGDFGQNREMFKKNINYIDDGGTGASIFNARLCQMIISAYCPIDGIMHDCFAGGGTRAIISSLMGNKYYGMDLRQGEITDIIARAEELDITCNKKDSQLTLLQGDSTKDYIKFEKESCNFGLTCPPYHDLEVYTDNKEDLSYNKSYSEFIELCYEVLKGCNYVLKKGSFYVWVIGNFRDKQGFLHHFNGDLVKQAERAGLKLHDEIIFDRGQGGALKREQQFEINRKSIKTHEYIIIFKKI